LTSAAPPGEASIWGKGPPEGGGFVQNGLEGEVGCVGNPVQLFGVDEGIGKGGLVPVEVERRGVASWFGGRFGGRIRLGDVGRGGSGFCGDNGIRWLLTYRLVLLFAAPFGFVDVWFDGRGRGLRPGWGKAAVRYQAFDRYDHRKGLDLAGDDASGHFVAEGVQFPEPGQDLVATEVQEYRPKGYSGLLLRVGSGMKD
jgi:hypothetical protein